MGTARVGRVLLAAAVGLAAGCVDRRFVVQTNVPGAQIYRDGQPLGSDPADGSWEYAGHYLFTASAPGYESVTEQILFKPKWYQFPPFDLFAEVLYPFRIEDRRVVNLTLVPTRPVNEQELVGAGDALRARGLALPPTTVPKRDNRQATPLPAPLPLGTGTFSPLPNNFLPGTGQPGDPTIPGGTVDRGDQSFPLPPTPTAPPAATPPTTPDQPPASPIGPNGLPPIQ